MFAWLMGATVAAIAAMLPAQLFLLDQPLFGASGDPVPLVVGFAIANIVLSAVAIAVGLHLEPSVRMGVPLLRSWLAGDGVVTRPVSPTLLRCSASGFSLAAMVLTCGWIFRSQLPELPEKFVIPPIWQGILMMLSAAVREEILFRLFALNLSVWLAMRVLRKPEPTTAIAWSTNVLVALIFALMHLLPAAQLLDLNAMAGILAIILATVAGVLLGWVYWRHGLLMAMFTHAVGGVLLLIGARGLMTFAS
ncbi:MAG: CPBP family intramembrane metalloprotease [Phycisphaerales bacterium]|nr:CPBP family intramembrane metalloprotease [Phycisphaerales bacterium]